MQVFDAIRDILHYSFLRDALLVGVLVALCASLLGISLVLKRYSMIGDGLSHVAFGALSIALALNMAPLKIAIPIVVVAAFLLLRISESSKIKGDSAIALISSSSLAFGLIVTSLKGGMNIDIQNYMFGTILAMNSSDVCFSIVLSILVIVIFVLLYNRIFAITFDESFTRATGTNVSVLKMLLAILTAITIVVGMRIMGTLLISSLIIFPVLTAMRVCNRFKTVLICSMIVSVVGCVVGFLCSYIIDLPVGASIVATNTILFLIFCVIGQALRIE